MKPVEKVSEKYVPIHRRNRGSSQVQIKSAMPSQNFVQKKPEVRPVQVDISIDALEEKKEE